MRFTSPLSHLSDRNMRIAVLAKLPQTHNHASQYGEEAVK